MSTRGNQVFVGFKCDAAFRAQVTAASRGEISQFVRDALIENLEAMGIRVDRALAEAPSRLRKGGPRKRTPLQLQHQNFAGDQRRLEPYGESGRVGSRRGARREPAPAKGPGG